MRARYFSTGNHSALPESYHVFEKHKQRIRFWALPFYVIASLTALGSCMFWENSDVGSGGNSKTPASFPTLSGPHFSTPAEGNTSRTAKTTSVTKGSHPQKVSHIQVGQHQPFHSQQNLPVAEDQRPQLSHPPPPSSKKQSRKKEELKGKTLISQSTAKGVYPPRSPTPKFLASPKRIKRLKRGSVLVKKRSYGKAIEVLEPLFTEPPEEWEAWFWMGTAQMGLGRYEKAQEYFREGLARDETIAELWVQCALVEYQRERYSQALNLLHQALLLAPSLPQVHLNLAVTLESQAYSQSALRHYRQYLSLTKHNPSYLSIRKKVLDRILNLEQP